jgi:hypothetical protein
MKNFAWINTDNNLVENVIVYDGETPLILPDNVILVEMPDGHMGSWSALGIGWSYIDGQFVEPPKPEPVIPLSANNQPVSTGSQTL